MRVTLSEFINKIGFRVRDEDVRQVNDTITGIKSTATKVLGAIGIGFSLANMNELVEEFDAVNDKINSAVNGLEDVKEAQRSILEAANDAKTSYSDMADIVSDLVKSSSDLFPVQDAIDFSTNVTKLLKSAGRADGEITGIMEAMNKSFQKGIVDSETLNQLLENAPEGANLLAKSLGVSKTELLTMASEGRMTVNDLKDAFLGATDDIDAAFSQLNFGISDALLNVRNKWGFWLKETDEMLGLTQTIGKTMVRGFDMAMGALNRFRNGVVWLTDKLGGTEKVMKLLGIIAGTIFGLQALSGIKAFIQCFDGLDKAALKARAKMLAIVAVIVLIALLVEDFINFMQGNDSVIGALLEKAGVDTDAVRQKIIDAWGSIKSFLLAAWSAIKAACSAIWGGIKDFFVKHGDEIKAALMATWNVIKMVLLGAWNIIKTVALTIFGGLQNFWAKHGEQVKTSFINIWNGIRNLLFAVWNAIKSAAAAVFNGLKAFWNTWGGTILTIFQGAWDTVKAVFSAALDVLADLFAVFSDLFSGNWSQLWVDLRQLASDVWNGILSIISTILTSIWNVLSSIWTTIWEFLSGIATNIWETITTTFTNIWTSIVETVGNIKDSIVEGFQAAIDWITSLPAQALQWGADIIQGIVDGITGAVGKVGEAVGTVADQIKSFLGFSEPEDGPLSDFHTYMPDMIDLMAQGIQKGRTVIRAAAKDLAGDMSNEVRGVDPDGGNKPEPAGGPHPTPKPGPEPSPAEPPPPTPVPKPALSKFPQPAPPPQSQVGPSGGKGQRGMGLGAILGVVKNGLSAMAGMAKPLPSTVSTVTGSNNVSRSIVQNVEINNKFEGDKAGQQKSAAAMDKAASDVTSELARGLAYTR